MGFQNTVNVQLAFGVPGALYDDSPVRATPWTLNSAQASYNKIGATAYTATTADPGDSSTSGVAAAGGTGQFVGVLANSKVYSTSGTTVGALNPTTTLPNQTIGELVSMGHLIVSLPGPANIGDKVCYDQTTGQLNSFAGTTSFTATILSTGVMTVTALVSGLVQPGMVLTGVGVNGVSVLGYGTGTGGVGTYNTDYVGSTVAAEAMSAPSLPPPAFSGTGVLTSTGVLTITAVSSGNIGVDSVLAATGFPANATVTALGTGTGGTGTYTVSPAPTTTTGSVTVTADQQVTIARAEVIRFQPAGNGGLAVISLTNA